MQSRLRILSCLAAAVAAQKKALVMIDTQECFLEGGSLPVTASQIIPNINQIRAEKECLFDVVVNTQDFHPAGHISFGTAHGMAEATPNEDRSNSWRGAMTMMCLNEVDNAACCPAFYVNDSSVACDGITEYCPTEEYNATNPVIKDNAACTVCADDPTKCFTMKMDLWLDHCLQNGDSGFAKNLTTKESDVIVQKGQQMTVEMYSGFFDNSKKYKSSLDQTLKDNNITEVVIVGIATTHCVRYSADDAVFLGYKTSVVMDASAGIWGLPGYWADEQDAKTYFAANNISAINTADVLAMTCGSSMTSEGDGGSEDGAGSGNGTATSVDGAFTLAAGKVSLMAAALLLMLQQAK